MEIFRVEYIGRLKRDLFKDYDSEVIPLMMDSTDGQVDGCIFKIKTENVREFFFFCLSFLFPLKLWG